MADIIKMLEDLTGLNQAIIEKFLTSIVLIFILVLLRWIVWRIVWKRTQDAQLRYRWRKWITYTTFWVGAFIIGRVWFAGFGSLATYFGLLSAGLAIALKDLVTGIAGWVFILWRKPFTVGDRVQIGEFQGDVIDVRLFKFSLMEIGNWVDADQSTGRIMHLPNTLVLTSVITNYSQGFRYIWHEIPVLVTFESDWEKAKEILRKLGQKHGEHLTENAQRRLKEVSKRYMIFYKTLTPTVYTTVRDCGVLLTIRYLIEPRNRRGSEEAIWEDILKEFKSHSDIDFAYPTQRFYDNTIEGKIGARAEKKV